MTATPPRRTFAEALARLDERHADPVRDARDRAVMGLLACGVTPRELAKIACDDLRWLPGLIEVVLVKPLSRRHVVVRLTHDATVRLTQYLAAVRRVGESGPLFLASDGGAMTANQVKSIRRRAERRGMA